MSLKVAFIGAGNLSWHLAPALDNIGAIVTVVYSRSPKSGELLVKKLYQADYQDNLDFSSAGIDLIFLTVADDAIEEIASELVVSNETIVVHTSGSQPIDILSDYFKRCGVFYPLQTFSKNKRINFSHVPFLVEGTDKYVISLLKQLADKLSGNVKIANSQDRAYVHLAAVFASNFSNHMITISKQILSEHNLDLKIMLPLISETINKAIDIGPGQAQTGPARRDDLKTLDKHMSMLQDNSQLSEIYRRISQHILDQYKQS